MVIKIMIKKSTVHIEIARSTAHGLGSMSRTSCQMIRAVLERTYGRVGVSIINNRCDLELLAAKRPDLVFLGTKRVPQGGGNPQSIWVADYLSRRGINHTGSPATAIRLDYHKPAAKQAIREAGLATADYFTAHPEQFNSRDELLADLPLFLKPPSAGGGQGIDAQSVVRDFAAFQSKVRAIYDKFGHPALVESYLPGREFSVAILDRLGDRPPHIMPIELITTANAYGDRILGHAVKSSNTESAIAVTDRALRHRLMRYAGAAYKALGGRGYGRIDLRLDAAGQPNFLEANLIPSLISGYGSFPKACLLNLGLDHPAMIRHIVELGLAHQVETSPVAAHSVQNDTDLTVTAG
jgi:D-alanine-D-alanine ligase